MVEMIPRLHAMFLSLRHQFCGTQELQIAFIERVQVAMFQATKTPKSRTICSIATDNSSDKVPAAKC